MKQTSSFLSLGLHPSLCSILSRARITTPTHIQFAALPSLLTTNHHHFIAAQTGTGKTLTYLLPYLHKYVKEHSGTKPKSIVITSNKELVLQLERMLEPFKRQLGVLSAALVEKDIPVSTMDVVCGTIDRIESMRGKKEISFTGVSELVVDECDTLVDSGKSHSIDTIVAAATAVPNLRVTLVSATFPLQLEAVLDSNFTTHPATTVLHPYLKRVIEERAHFNLEHIKHEFVPNDTKGNATFLRLLVDVSKEAKGKGCIVFCNSKESVEAVVRLMGKQRYKVGGVHSEMGVEDRVREYEEFRKGGKEFLVCTDLCSRGLDFQNVSHVIQYDFPKTTSDYLHRAGRTGRCFRKGTVITLYRKANERLVNQLQSSFEDRTPLRLSSPALS